MAYTYERPDLRAVADLEELVQHLAGELATWRRRSHTAESELQAIRAKGGVYEGPELSGARQRIVDLEAENQALRERIEAATERVRALAARIAFLEQGGSAS